MSNPVNEAEIAMSYPLPLSDEDQSTYEASPGVLSSSLPYPDPSSLDIPPEQKKKSHARKQPAGHVPRPRNAFILFRCDFVRQKKVPDHVEVNHRNISRIVGAVWKNMSASQKAPWVAMAETEKKNHAKAHPGYKYHPAYEIRGRETRVKKVFRLPTLSNSNVPSPNVSPHWTPPPSFTPPIAPLRRSSSCPPPGAFPVPPEASLGQSQVGLSTPSITRDDLSRRPSRTIMYQSHAPLSSLNPNPALSAASLPPLAQPSLSSQWWATDPGTGASLRSGPYSIAPPGDAPGWDAGHIRPDTWNQWSDSVASPHATQMEPYDLNTSFTGPVAKWNAGTVTFTNPFGSTLKPTNNRSLAWNFDVSTAAAPNTTGPEPMSVDMPALSLPSDTLSTDHAQNDLSLPSGGYTLDYLGNLLRTRLSLVDGASEVEERHSMNHQLHGVQSKNHILSDDDRFIPRAYPRAMASPHSVSQNEQREPCREDEHIHQTSTYYPVSNRYETNRWEADKEKLIPTAFPYALPSSSRPSSNITVSLPAPPVPSPRFSREDIVEGLELQGLTPEKSRIRSMGQVLMRNRSGSLHDEFTDLDSVSPEGQAGNLLTPE